MYDFKSLFDAQMARVNKDGAFWDKTNNVMNGIAYNSETKTFFVTGKNWNYIFEVELE